MFHSLQCSFFLLFFFFFTDLPILLPKRTYHLAGQWKDLIDLFLYVIMCSLRPTLSATRDEGTYLFLLDSISVSSGTKVIVPCLYNVY